eukprot:361440-Chlamydomonas_euryale.AAC.9
MIWTCAGSWRSPSSLLRATAIARAQCPALLESAFRCECLRWRAWKRKQAEGKDTTAFVVPGGDVPGLGPGEEWAHNRGRRRQRVQVSGDRAAQACAPDGLGVGS